MMIPFAKYQALGNSFVVLDEIPSRFSKTKFSNLARCICNRSLGVGADGLMVVLKSGDGYRVEVFNSDGSWAEKSGNGLRIAAMHLFNGGLLVGKQVEIKTGSGTSRVSFHGGSRHKRIISASLGRPEFETASIPIKGENNFFVNQTIKMDGRSMLASAVSVGNPHLILFCDDFNFDWESIGEALEVDPLFPERINVGFVVVRDKKTIEVRDWERGAGPTRSSGTGAAAAAVISVLRGFTDRKVKVVNPAGTLAVEWVDKSDEIIIKGPVEFVMAGQYYKR